MDTVTHPKGTSQDRPDHFDPPSEFKAAALADPFAKVFLRDAIAQQNIAIWESTGGKAFQSFIAQLEDAIATGWRFVKQHDDDCECAFCDADGGVNFTRGELHYEVRHITHSIRQFLNIAGCEGGSDPYDGALKNAEFIREMIRDGRADPNDWNIPADAAVVV